MKTRSALRALPLLLALAAPTALADTASPGYELSTLPMPTGMPFYGTVTCTLPSGDIVTFDGTQVERWSANGILVQNLGSIPLSGFSAFILPTPDGSGVVFAHSGDFFAGVPGELFEAPLSGAGVTSVVQIQFAYDAVFLAGGDLLVSANTAGGAQTNDLIRVGLKSSQTTNLGTVSGPSGPLALRGGDLYYAPAEIAFPAPAGSGEIVYWTAAQLAAGGLNDTNWTVWATGYDPIVSMSVDPVKDRIFVGESVLDSFGNLVTGSLRWARKNVAKAELIAVPDKPISGLEFVNTAGGAANFQSYQPGNGSNLKYNTSVFAGSAEHHTVLPKRATVTASGPGLVGLGPVTLTATDAPANGTLYLIFGPQAQMSTTEQTYVHPGYLFHTYLAPASTRRLPFILPTDATGSGSFTMYNDGSLTGAFGYQYLVGDGTATFLGSTGVVTF